MKSKKISFFIIILLGICLVLIIILLVINQKKESKYSCYYIPVGDGSISWGMTKEEIIAAFGEPTSMGDSEYGFVLSYESLIPSELGSCSKLALFFGNDESAYLEDQTVPNGLGIIEMTINNTTKEIIKEKLTKIYGDLIDKTTQMELNLKQSKPAYFNKNYYNENWMIRTLSKEEYSKLVEFYENSTNGGPIDEKKSLMDIRISGVEEGDNYDCNVRLDAYVLSCLESVNN